jgi:hypothetical protein
MVEFFLFVIIVILLGGARLVVGSLFLAGAALVAVLAFIFIAGAWDTWSAWEWVFMAAVICWCNYWGWFRDRPKSDSDSLGFSVPRESSAVKSMLTIPPLGRSIGKRSSKSTTR